MCSNNVIVSKLLYLHAGVLKLFFSFSNIYVLISPSPATVAKFCRLRWIQLSYNFQKLHNSEHQNGERFFCPPSTLGFSSPYWKLEKNKIDSFFVILLQGNLIAALKWIGLLHFKVVWCNGGDGRIYVHNRVTTIHWCSYRSKKYSKTALQCEFRLVPGTFS